MPELKNRLIINNQDVTSWTTGLNGDNSGLKVLYVLNNADRTTSYAASGTFNVSGPGYLLLKELILDVAKNYTCQLVIKGITTIEFQVNARGVKDCGCDAQIVIQSEPEDYRKYLGLTEVIISDRQAELFAEGHMKRVPYCNEPNSTQYLLIYLYIFFGLVIDTIQAVISIFVDQYDKENLGNECLGCVRYHFAWNAGKTFRHYAINAGLSWSSSILDTTFQRLHILDGYGHEGYRRDKLDINKAPDKVINFTVPQVLSQLSLVFNADYRVINGVLHFERKDWFPANARKIDGTVVGDFCVEADPSQLYTNIKFEYATDQGDETSQKVTPTYSGRVDLNPMEYKALKGTRTIAPRIAVSRFVRDGFGDEYIRKLRNEGLMGGVFLHDFILTNGQTTELRLLDLQATSNGDYYYATHEPFEPGPDIYQKRLLFRDYEGQPGYKAEGFLYDNYWYIEDPKLHPRYYTSEIQILAKDVCAALDSIDDFNMNVYFQTDYGRALPEEIDFDPKTSIFTFKKVTIWP